MILISVDEYERLKAVEESAARLRAAVERIAAMPSDADRWLDDTERPQTVARAALDALPSAPVVSGWQQRACEAIRKAIEDEDGLDGLEGEALLREIGYWPKQSKPPSEIGRELYKQRSERLSPPVVTQEGE